MISITVYVRLAQDLVLVLVLPLHRSFEVYLSDWLKFCFFVCSELYYDTSDKFCAPKARDPGIFCKICAHKGQFPVACCREYYRSGSVSIGNTWEGRHLHHKLIPPLFPQFLTSRNKNEMP